MSKESVFTASTEEEKNTGNSGEVSMLTLSLLEGVPAITAMLPSTQTHTGIFTQPASRFSDQLGEASTNAQTRNCIDGIYRRHLRRAPASPTSSPPNSSSVIDNSQRSNGGRST